MNMIRTNNKIAACQWCVSPLTPAQEAFCTDDCREKHEAHEKERPEEKRCSVYLNLNMLNLAIGERARPLAFSHFLFTGHELVCVALFNESDLLAIPDRQSNAYEAWWREVTLGAIPNIEPHQPTVMREEGLLSYLGDRFGITTERAVSAAIDEIARIEGITPVDLFNTL